LEEAVKDILEALKKIAHLIDVKKIEKILATLET